MTSEIAHYLAAAGRMADMDRIFQFEMVGNGLQIVGIVIEVVAIGDLRRTAMAAPIVRDDAIALVKEEQHLRIPVIRRQRPTVAEYDWLSFTPVFVVDFHSVFR